MIDGLLIFVDFETRSRVDLTKVGGRAYVRHKSTELLCGVALVLRERFSPVGYRWAPWPAPAKLRTVEPPCDDPRLQGITWCDTWESDDPHPGLLRAAPHATVIAHNAAGFDRPLWEDLGYPAPARWADSLDRARRASLPGKLDDIGERLFGQGKDVGGHKLMLRHCKPQGGGDDERAGAFTDPAAVSLAGILHYCARDVLLLAALWLREGLGEHHVDDPVLHAHEVIDARGIPIDLAYAARLKAAEERMTSAALEQAAAHGVGETLLRSSSATKGLPAWLASQGFPVADVTSETCERLLERIEERIAFLLGEEAAG